MSSEHTRSAGLGLALLLLGGLTSCDGNPSTAPEPDPIEPPIEVPLANVRLASWESMTVELRGEQVFYWGRTSDPATTLLSSATPQPVPADPRLVTLATGQSHHCGLTASGEAYCFGNNHRGKLGIGLAEQYGLYPEPQRVEGDHRFHQIVGGHHHTCAITHDGSAYCWGWGAWGQLGDGDRVQYRSVPVPVAGGRRFVAIAAGARYTCALTVRGEPFCWGTGFLPGPEEPELEPVAIPTEYRFVSIDAGWWVTCGLTSEGTVVCWSIAEEPMPVSGAPRFRTVAVGGIHNCGLTEQGRAYCWGRNQWGQLGDGTTTDRDEPVEVSGGHTFEHITAGVWHTCARTPAMETYCWGVNGNHALGIGPGEMINPVPVQLSYP